MTKSFRNLILSLLLTAGAAGFAACEGERGPVGETGPAGAAGADGAKGAAGDAGKSSEEIPSAYEFLKTWGKPGGMAACSDDIFNKKMPAALPGPADSALAKVVTSRDANNTTSVPFNGLSGNNNQPYTGNAISIPANEGQCSRQVFILDDPTPFQFKHERGNNNKMKEAPKRGSTAVLGNPTLTTKEKQFWGGTFLVDVAPAAVEIEEMKRLLVRCDVGEEATDSTVSGQQQKRRIRGEYRVVLNTETENLLAEDNGTVSVKDNDNNPATRSLYEVSRYTTQICLKFPFAPGAVKCLVKTYAEKRIPSDDKRDTTANSAAITEQMIVYDKDGKMTPVPPMYPNNLLAGFGSGSPDNFPFAQTGLHSTVTPGGPDVANIKPAAKLCNFLAGGVIPCGSGKVPERTGGCVTP